MAEAAELWVCELCERIGSNIKAREHAHETGHTTRRLGDGEALAVRAMWRQEGKDEWGRSPRLRLDAGALRMIAGDGGSERS